MKFKIYTLLLFSFCSTRIFAQIAQIPFELFRNKYVLFHAKMGVAKDSLTFFFDTGATTCLLDSTQAVKNNIQPNFQQEVEGAGGKTTYLFAKNQSLKLNPKTQLDSLDFVITDLSRLKKSLGKNFDGIMGYALIKQYVTQINFDQKTISLYTNVHQLDTTNYSVLNFNFKNGIPIPQFDVSITLKNGTTYTDTVFFDSGAGLSLLVNTPFAKKNNLIQNIGKFIPTSNNNLSKQSFQVDASIAKIKIGNYTFSDLPISIADDQTGVSSFEGYLGILGSEIINRFNLILDYAQHKIYLKPNHLFRTPFEFPMSGITLMEENSQIKVGKITTACEAYQKGMREGDTILKINDLENSNLEEYREILNQKNSKVRITFRNHKGERQTIKILLRRLI